MNAMPRLPPELRARLGELRIVARRTTAVGGIGQHISRNRGAGLEFSQYRAYEQGDEPRRIDWKLYARSDRWFVRESERDSALEIHVLVDATASMAQADAARPGVTKLDAARILTAAIVELAFRQGDRFGALAIGDGRLVPTPVGAGLRQRDACLHALETWDARGGWPAEAALRRVFDRVPHHALVVLLSDVFDDTVIAFAERLAATQREVLTIQLLGADEVAFPFEGGHRFVDPESGAELTLDAGAARRAYLERFEAAQRALARRYAAAGIRHVVHVLDQPLFAPLRRLFGARGAEALRA
ncbi:MAG TPA: DUF58 domain-containing protein [Xanthomonadales bacterium]|nr:DUF58 domain-containing protein [Xanthomonadales bacterium]